MTRRRTIAKFEGRDGETVAAVLRPGPFPSVNLLVVTEKGTITKRRYDARAELVSSVERFTVGATVGHGFYKKHAGTSAAGSECGVYGVNGEGFFVAMPGGGFTSTRDDDVEVEITETAAREALELGRTMLAEAVLS